MITLQGKGVFGGIAIGEIAFFKRSSVSKMQKQKPLKNSVNCMTKPFLKLARAMPCFSRHISSCWKIWTM